MYDMGQQATAFFSRKLGKRSRRAFRKSNLHVPEALRGEARALNIHTFVKFDEFWMNVSPNLMRDRRNPCVIIVKFN